MDVNDGVIHLVVPGWVWLLLIAAVMFVIAARIAKKQGGVRKIYQWDSTDSYGWSVLFTLMVGMSAALLAGVAAYFVSS